MNREWVLVALVAMAAVLNVPIVHSQAPSFPPSAPCSSTSQCQSIYGLCWQCAGSCYPIAYQGPISNATYPRTAVCNDRVWGWLDNSTTRTACNYLTQPPNPIAACLNGQIVVGFEEKVCERFLTPFGANPPSCDFGCNNTAACIRGSNYTGVNDRPDRVCLNDAIANPTSAGCGLSTAAPCNNWIAGVSGASCLRYSTTSRGLCRANTTAGWCDTSVNACTRAGVATQTYETCGSAECLNTQACVAGAPWASAGSVCLRNVDRSACGAPTACSDYLAGWDDANPNVCLKYSEASVSAFCDGSSTCKSGVESCANRANETYITCSSGCRRLCDRGQPLSSYPLSQVCHTDYQQHGCGAGLVCDASGQCAAPPPITPPISVPPPIQPPVEPPTSNDAPMGSPVSTPPASNGGVPSAVVSPSASSPSLAPSGSSSPNGRNSSPNSGAGGVAMYSAAVWAAVLLAFAFASM
eukprot:TRINITY_DN575_c0_g1_i1.p1 TRINITY_DN575_c0_g1~~TRINITY_DN575_c0_g1_i1.p1  ORF type:complete len:468 (-),score=26.47 TRINITY_DN575_c0_g1_i1:53-1456(-)